MRALYVLVTFFGAGLLFWSEPMLSKQVLPVLGGSPAVWNTCVFFYQVMLLAGYAWAHGLSRLRNPKHQALLQVGLGLLGLAFSMQVVVAPTDSPIGWLMLSLLGAAGLPFLVLASGAPLYQRWFSRISDQDPYRLYVASNVGSFAALLAFPFVIEPLFPVELQRGLWRAAYVVFLGLLLAAGWFFARRAEPLASVDPASEGPAESLAWPRRLRWLLLAAAPSSLSLGTTTFLSTDIAPVPLLWVVPLAIYLLTFILAFGAKDQRVLAKLWPLFGIFALLELYTVVIDAPQALVPTTILHLVVLFLAARLCHGELAADRPSPLRLTEFYLWISLGGALGGLFNGVLAPVLFDSLLEYPLALLACLALAPYVRRPGQLRNAALAGAALFLLWLVLRYALPFSPLRSTLRTILVYGAPAVGLVWAWRSRNLGLATAVAAPVIIATLAVGFHENQLHQERTYFGLYRVKTSHSEGRDYRLLFHGRILHGMQRHSDQLADRAVSMSYYHQRSPVGEVFRSLSERTARSDIAVVGLGVGSLAALARAGDSLVFYEIDPAVVRLATGAGYFTYLSDSPADVSTVVGDGRLMLANEARAFDLLVIDAFGSDAIPMHLLSREALEQVYVPRLKEGGAIAWHVSNRFLDIRRVVAGLAQGAGLRCWVRTDKVEGARQLEASSSVWVLVAKDGEPPTQDWQTCPASDVRWTDGWSNLLQVFMPD